MTSEEDGVWALLRSLDDPTHLEHPADFDLAATRGRFTRLVAELTHRFDSPLVVDDHVEDATLHASLTVPARATETGDPLTVYVSNFGNLATITLDNAGAWTQSEFDERASPADVGSIEEALDMLGYVVVPEEPLWADYDGPAPIGRLDPRFGPTWWTRFFDYL
ncbi:hypothetical protein ACIRN4_26620 [Pimelobacter simplex]|uniref:hypothetical protein n=1 Tax=Nocardioides simplex TaxID=2045 RepID=UPI00382AEA5A